MTIELKNKIKQTVKKIVFSLPSSAVIMLHHVTDNPEHRKSGCLISEDKFYNFINSFSEYESIKNVLKNPGERKITLTFDDGLEDVYTVAYPFLKAKNIPFTVFIATDLIDTEGYITKSQLLELSNNTLVTVGAHGTTHGILKSMTKDMQEKELSESARYLESLTGKKVEYFAYSHGQYDSNTLKLAKMFKYCFTTSAKPLNALTKIRKSEVPRINLTNELLDSTNILLNEILFNNKRG